ncbi:PadR family transcriptional regulator [Nakamurella sp.]|uniref:PadR family transcriptional regulator n=1 Tax=Nakamurella sp. TaxID=1869182 RepID=UPI003B3A9170
MTNQGRTRTLRPSPLTLMVLVLLAEAPMHPYEMQRVMQARGKDTVVRVQRGSLYPAVERLAAAGLIEPAETERAGRRPERTVYRITEDGRETAELWLTGMLREVRNEYAEFPAALSFLPLLSAADARIELTARLVALGKSIAAIRSVTDGLNDRFRLPRLFLIETEYQLTMLEAEYRWVAGVVDDIAEGRLSWDDGQIKAWADEVQQRIGLIPGMARPMTGGPAP